MSPIFFYTGRNRVPENNYNLQSPSNRPVSYCSGKVFQALQNGGMGIVTFFPVAGTVDKSLSITMLANMSPYFSITNVHLVDINVFANFYEIPSLPFQDIEKRKRRERENSIPQHKHSLREEV